MQGGGKKRRVMTLGVDGVGHSRDSLWGYPGTSSWLGAQARARRRGGCDVLITKYTKSDKDRSKIQNSR